MKKIKSTRLCGDYAFMLRANAKNCWHEEVVERVRPSMEPSGSAERVPKWVLEFLMHRFELGTLGTNEEVHIGSVRH